MCDLVTKKGVDVRGAELVFPEPAKAQPSQALLRRRAYLSRRAEEREYERLTSSFREKPRENVVSSMQYQITIAANMIVAPVATFFIFYIFARAVTVHQHWRIAAGLFGLILMLVIEMILFITRSYAIETMINNDTRKKKKSSAKILSFDTRRTEDQGVEQTTRRNHQQSTVKDKDI